MKVVLSIILLFVGVLIIGCLGGQKIVAEFPQTISKTERVALKEQFEKGKVFYDITCAKCHIPAEYDRNKYPDFSPEQLNAYRIRISNPNHEENLMDKIITQEELEMIIVFFTYKKKNKPLE